MKNKHLKDKLLKLKLSEFEPNLDGYSFSDFNRHYHEHKLRKKIRRRVLFFLISFGFTLVGTMAYLVYFKSNVHAQYMITDWNSNGNQDKNNTPKSNSSFEKLKKDKAYRGWSQKSNAQLPTGQKDSGTRNYSIQHNQTLSEGSETKQQLLETTTTAEQSSQSILFRHVGQSLITPQSNFSRQSRLESNNKGDAVFIDSTETQRDIVFGEDKRKEELNTDSNVDPNFKLNRSESSVKLLSQDTTGLYIEPFFKLSIKDSLPKNRTSKDQFNKLKHVENNDPQVVDEDYATYHSLAQDTTTGEPDNTELINQSEVIDVADSTDMGSEPSSNSNKSKTCSFDIAVEGVYNNVTPLVDAGNYMESPFDEGYTLFYLNGHSQTTEKSPGATLLFGLSYKNIGLNTGLGFVSLKYNINTANNYFRVYKREIDKIVTVDSIISGQPVTYTNTYYKTVEGPKIIIVNGDTVSPGVYRNTIRFITIPLNLSYRISLFQKRLTVEPAVGIQFAIPIASRQLIVIKPRVFEYSKSRTALRTINIFYDFALKAGYQINKSINLYAKQGYFFSNKSIYNDNYLVRINLTNVYTCLGVCISIK